MNKNDIVYLVDLVSKWQLCLGDIDTLVRGRHLKRLDKNGRACYRILTEAFAEYT